jgi:hypothetical protein
VSPPRQDATDGGAGDPQLIAAVHDALSDLYAQLLVLDAELRRTCAHAELVDGLSVDPDERDRIKRRCRELRTERDALRGKIDELRAKADPEGRYL